MINYKKREIILKSISSEIIKMYTTSPAFSIPSTSRKAIINDSDNSPGPAYNTFGLNRKHKSLSYGIGMSRRT